MTRPSRCIIILLTCFILLHINAYAQPVEYRDSLLKNAYTGICIYDVNEGKYIYELNADKYFVPASNIKIFTLYAGLHYLIDSLPGILVTEYKDHIEIEGTGDPTILNSAFVKQPVIDFLKNTSKKIILIDSRNFRTEAYGPGWSWEDYDEAFMPERSELPLFGNCITVRIKEGLPSYTPQRGIEVYLSDDSAKKTISREIHNNKFYVSAGLKKDTELTAPFIGSLQMAAGFLKDSLGKEIYFSDHPTNSKLAIRSFFIKTYPVDSVFIPMMHNSNNFFAEQTLLMAGFVKNGYLDEKVVIKNILEHELSDLPQNPFWIDASGLSRYNLASPRDIVQVLQKLEGEFGRNRMMAIFPAGGEGTLKGHYESPTPFIYAKTGSMGHINALSGYLFTKKGKLLIFSILINSHPLKSTAARSSIERFLMNIRNTY